MVNIVDGICEECGNTGIPGEVCVVCGTRIKAVDEDLEQFEEDAVPAVVRKPRVAPKAVDGDDDELEGVELEADMEDLEGLVDEEEGGKDRVSLQRLADEENDREDKEAWFDPDSFNVDEDEEEEK